MWRQGEHVAIIGDTGSGKTFLEATILRLGLRKYVVVFKVKADPDDRRNFRGFTRIGRLAEMGRTDCYFLQPARERQQWEGWQLCEKAYKEGSWTVVIDELWHAEHKLGLGSQIDMLLTQGRSKGISMVCGAQRPAQISRFVLSQCTHLFAFRCEGRDILTVAESTTPRVKEVFPKLGKYEYLYYNRSTRELTTGTAANVGGLLT